MSLISTEELRPLVESRPGMCVSIYLPMIRAGAETRQNAIRFKNALKQANLQLQAQGLSSDAAAQLLQPAADLDHEDFWQHQDCGLALFVGEDFLRNYQLPTEVNERVVVGDRFHLKPLLPFLTNDGEFYILVLNQQQVRFLSATRYTVRQVEIEGMPQSLQDTLQYDETAKTGQFRIQTGRGGTANTAVQAGSYHGQGSPDRDEHQKDILQFFYAIDHALHPYLVSKRGPLILVAIEYLLPLYHAANTYPHLLETGVDINAQTLDPEAIHAQVLPLIEPLLEQEKHNAIEHYYELSDTGKTSTDLNETVAGAYYGRVDQLFVAVDIQRWGNFDMQNNEIEIHPEAQPGDEDLLDSAAMQTLLNGGMVYAVRPEEVPDQAPLAAIFRY